MQAEKNEFFLVQASATLKNDYLFWSQEMDNIILIIWN